MLSSNLKLKLYKLLSLPRWRGRLGPEAAVQQEFVQHLIYWTLTGRLKCVWGSIANENGSNSQPVFGALLRTLGKIKGAPDMIFMWKDGSGCIEFKAGKNKQTPEQKVYQEWCNESGVNYVVAYSAAEAIEHLSSWGVLSE